MKLKEKSVAVSFLDTFRVKTLYRFNCLCIGSAFRTDGQWLVVGGEDGVIRIYDTSTTIQPQKPQILLETKGGPIQTMGVHDVTKFYFDDLVVGDSNGTLTVFCNQQILCRHSLSKDCMRCLQIHSDQLGNSSIVVSDESGYICAVLPSKALWRVNINDLSVPKGPAQKVVITSLLSTELVTPSGEKCSYILAADDSKHLHLLQQGQVVMTIATPAVVSAMCGGVFLDADKLDVGSDVAAVKDRRQVALGCTNGAIYILHNFSITEEEFANAKYHISKLLCHPSPAGKLDYLLCSGHFNSLHIYAEGKRVSQYETPDWINSMDISSVTTDKRTQIVVGCLDNTILGLTLMET